jgi:hypothetical protein
MLPSPQLEVIAGGVVGQVLHVDHFGNIVTSIGELVWAGDGLVLGPVFGTARDGAQSAGCRIVAANTTVVVAGREIKGVQRAYAEVASGEVLALVGSSGYLEVAVREGSAALRLEVHPGDEVVLRF